MEKNDKKSNNVLPDYSSFFKGAEDNGKVPAKVLKSIFKSNKKEFTISTLLYFVKACALWIVPIVTANVINIVTTPAEPNHSLYALFFNCIILLILIIQNLYTHVLYINYTSKALRNVGVGLRNSLIKKLQQISLTYHKELQSGALQSKFIHDVEAIESLLNQLVINLFACIVNVVITVIITVVKSPAVTAFFAVIIPLNVLIVYLFRKKMRVTNKNYRKEVENVSSKVTTMLEMIPITKAHGLEDTEINKMESSLLNLRSAGMYLDHINARFSSSSWVTSTALSAICLMFTGFLAYTGKITVGEVVLFQSYFSTISGNIQSLLNIYPEITKGTESIKSVSEIMISENIENNSGKIKLRYVHGTVQFRNVYYRYPHMTKNVIKNFSLDVDPGECVAFVGSSGSGKSTIMNMIIGSLDATDGEVLIDGKPMGLLNLHDYRKFISVVPQNCILFNGSIRDNITYGIKNVTEDELQKVLELANINEFLAALPEGLDTIVEEHGGNLSGGQKQRISIARALIRNPKIIILDEATSALDNISEFHIQKAMSSLKKDRTTFIVAHRLSTIRDADKIVVMENGEGIESGTFEELINKKGKFYNLKTLSEINT